ncbi:MAG TPA: shikimate dehydrogenase [Solirubrobacteraceae bacterium]|nr:shikimate dehydrogenase [Solirubrobacteraceae bacterium]
MQAIASTRLGVLGWPVAHSRSPAMHNAALAALGLHDWRYQLLPVPPAALASTVRALPGSGFLGANVTIPHKQSAFALADSVSDAGKAIGAVNTLTFERDGTIAAENTDAPGLIAALPTSPRGVRALVLGAGGSARAAVWALQSAGAGEVLVWNRTRERASALAGEMGARAVARAEPAELLVNCTSVGLAQADDAVGPAGAGCEEPLQPSARDAEALNQLGLTFDQVGEYPYVVDMAYRAGSTALLRAARAHRAHAVDGLEVLVAQGARSLELWTGKSAPVALMLRAARGQDGAP